MSFFDWITVITLPFAILGAINTWQTMRFQYLKFRLDIESGTYYQEKEAQKAREIQEAIETIWWYPILLHIVLYWYINIEEIIIDGWIFHPWNFPHNIKGYRDGNADVD